MVAAGNLGFLSENTRRRYFVVGGDTGLRGYPVSKFSGRGAEFIGHIEARTMALKLGFLRLGGLLFFDAGDAAPEASSLTFYDDVGSSRSSIPTPCALTGPSHCGQRLACPQAGPAACHSVSARYSR